MVTWFKMGGGETLNAYNDENLVIRNKKAA